LRREKIGAGGCRATSLVVVEMLEVVAAVDFNTFESGGGNDTEQSTQHRTEHQAQ
jgi:hypothetical protein